jgi:hypothetical protein
LHFIGAMVVIESRKERRSAAKLARFGHVPRHQCCCPPRSAEAADRQHTPLSAAVPAISPRLCFLGTVAVGRGRRVIAQNGCLMANNVAGGIAHGLTPYMVNDAQLPSPSWPCCLSAPRRGCTSSVRW